MREGCLGEELTLRWQAMDTGVDNDMKLLGLEALGVANPPVPVGMIVLTITNTLVNEDHICHLQGEFIWLLGSKRPNDFHLGQRCGGKRTY